MLRPLLILAGAFTALAPVAHAASPGTLVPLPGLDACVSNDGTDAARAADQVCRMGSGLNGVNAVAISPDGRYAYAAGIRSSLSILARDPGTGALTPLACVSADGTDGRSGTCAKRASMQGPVDVAVSPDGQNVYVASEDEITEFDRDPVSGLLSEPPGTAACVSEDGSGGACFDGKNVDGSQSLAFSPDGSTLYSATTRGGISILRRAPDGSLSQSTDPRSGCITENGADQDNTGDTTACVDGKALDTIAGLAVAPDGKTVCASDFEGSDVAVLGRDLDTGELSQSPDRTGCVSESGDDSVDVGVCTQAISLDGPASVQVSPDGRNVYVAALMGNSVAVFARDPVSGQLNQPPGLAACLSEDGTEQPGGPAGQCGVARGLEQPFGLAFTADGRNAYVGSFVFGVPASVRAIRGVIAQAPDSSGGIAAFARDPAGGALEQLPGMDGCVNEAGGPVPPALADGCAPALGIQGIDDVTLSPDDRTLYTGSAASSAVAEFARASGDAGPSGPASPDTTAPTVSGFSLTHRSFALARAATLVSALARGTAFRFALSEPGKVRISIQHARPGRRVGRHCRKPSTRLRHHRACKRLVAAGTLRRTEQAGHASVRFSGRIGRRALRPGRYRATIRATDSAGNVSKPKSAAFRILKAHHG